MLTFEKIRDFERAERESKELQKLPDNVIEEIKDYIRKKEAIAEKSSSDIIEIENVKKIVRNFFELREKKIVDLALYSVRTQLPIGNLLNIEEKVLAALVNEIKKYREEFREVMRKQDDAGKEEFVYRIKKSIPEFVGPDMKVYKLNENDIIESLPQPLNELLLKEGVIEEVRKPG